MVMLLFVCFFCCLVFPPLRWAASSRLVRGDARQAEAFMHMGGEGWRGKREHECKGVLALHAPSDEVCPPRARLVLLAAPRMLSAVVLSLLAGALAANMNGNYTVSSGSRYPAPFNTDYASKGYEYFDVW
jgi:hypothetical protein